MNNSDKEFREYWGYPSGVKALEYEREVKKVWDKLYPYKERCEELAELLHKEEIHRVSDVQMQQLEIQTLQAKVKELEGILKEAKAMTACHNLICDQECECLNCKFWSKYDEI